ncbi:MAG: NHL repeat-containing protein [Acidimicrobiales bacterium]
MTARHRWLKGGLVALVLLLAACSRAQATPRPKHAGPSGEATSPPSNAALGIVPGTPAWLAALERKAAGSPSYLQPGSNPSVLPGPVLIADRNNSRLLLVDPKGQILWQFPSGAAAHAGNFSAPDDAFFGPNGNEIIATEESNFSISTIALSPKSAMGKITWTYGHPGVAGSAANYLDNPDDAMMLPNGDVLTADIKNCRILLIAPGTHTPEHIYGVTDPFCFHNPPVRFGSPNGVFPMTNGDYLVTEINGNWVDEMNLSGQILWSTHPPGVSYPSDTNEVRPGVFLTADYSNPGQVEMFNQFGQLLWRYRPTGAQALNRPSLAIPLPNGDVLINDDWNHRVIVVDPATNQIVWQYGHTDVPGSAPGYLDKPDGVDLAPPYSLLVTHAATMGLPPAGLSPPPSSLGAAAGSASATGVGP